MMRFVMVGVASFLTGADAYGRSLADCQDVASQFLNVADCGSTAKGSVADYTGDLVTCGWMPHDTCPDIATLLFDDNGNEAGCTWRRTLCVTCTEVDGIARIRMQSNNLPNHCFHKGGDVNPKALDVDFEVNFNPIPVNDRDAADPAELDHIVCNAELRTQRRNLSYCPLEYNFVDHGTFDVHKKIQAVFLNGVNYQRNTASNTDPIFVPEGNRARHDKCMGHAQDATGMYHYHAFSPCVVDPTINDPTPGQKFMLPCSKDDDCNDNTIDYMLKPFNTIDWRRKRVFGLIPSGHVVYGPYDDNGKLWIPNDVDMCNGLTLGDDHYAYVATMWHPYVFGCYGKGSHPDQEGIFHQCSRNNRENWLSLNAESDPLVRPVGCAVHSDKKDCKADEGCEWATVDDEKVCLPVFVDPCANPVKLSGDKVKKGKAKLESSCACQEFCLLYPEAMAFTFKPSTNGKPGKCQCFASVDKHKCSKKHFSGAVGSEDFGVEPCDA